MLWFKFFFVFALLLCLIKLPCFVEARTDPSSYKRGLSYRRFVGFWMEIIIIMFNSSKNLLKLMAQGVVSHSFKPKAHNKISLHEKQSLSLQMYPRVQYTSHIFLCRMALLFGFPYYIHRSHSACSMNDSSKDWRKAYAWFVLKANVSAWHYNIVKRS